jgi:hypothetical protein
MFNPKIAEKYIDENTNLILRLFSLYQIIEITLFIKLFENSYTSDLNNNQEFIKFEKRISSKTLGKIIKEYEVKYPKDDFLILQDLKTIKKERNNFMHSMWVILAVCNSQDEARKYGDYLLKKYNDTASKVFNTVLDPNFLKK